MEALPLNCWKALRTAMALASPVPLSPSTQKRVFRAVPVGGWVVTKYGSPPARSPAEVPAA